MPNDPQENNKLPDLLKFIEDLFKANGLHDDLPIGDPSQIDPRTIPESAWIDYTPIIIPTGIAKYIDSPDAITIDETNAIEIALEKFYNIPEGRWYIMLDSMCLIHDNSQTPLKVSIKKPLQFLLLREPA